MSLDLTKEVELQRAAIVRLRDERDELAEALRQTKLALATERNIRRGGIEIGNRTVEFSPPTEGAWTIWGGLFYFGLEQIHLTESEFVIVSLLFSNPGRVVTKELIYKHLYQNERDVKAKILDVMVCKIRKKLRDSAPSPIRTIWGRGFSWDGLGASPLDNGETRQLIREVLRT